MAEISQRLITGAPGWGHQPPAKSCVRMRALLQGPHGLDDISTGHPLVDSRSISEVVADLLEQPRRACRSTGATGATGPWRGHWSFATSPPSEVSDWLETNISYMYLIHWFSYYTWICIKILIYLDLMSFAVNKATDPPVRLFKYWQYPTIQQCRDSRWTMG